MGHAGWRRRHSLLLRIPLLAGKPTIVDILSYPVGQIGGSAQMGMPQNLVDVLELNACLFLHCFTPETFTHGMVGALCFTLASRRRE
ncbi:hypothetical protein ACE10X_25325 [Bradyrhizobium sp. Pha-3]|uniref:hypothetical protein n=1 Tax=Bradyrhizobium sp. Pha-3 TaxID=208375 RepID=UPI0035D3E4BC